MAQPKEKKVEREFEIANELGLHARPAAMFVKLANRFRAEIVVSKDGEAVNGKSIMGVMMLAAGKGSKIKISAVGEDAPAVLGEFDKLLKNKFGEE